MGSSAQADLQTQLCQQRAPVSSGVSEAQILLARVLGISGLQEDLLSEMLHRFGTFESIVKVAIQSGEFDYDSYSS